MASKMNRELNTHLKKSRFILDVVCNTQGSYLSVETYPSLPCFTSTSTMVALLKNENSYSCVMKVSASENIEVRQNPFFEKKRSGLGSDPVWIVNEKILTQFFVMPRNLSLHVRQVRSFWSKTAITHVSYQKQNPLSSCSSTFMHWTMYHSCIETINCLTNTRVRSRNFKRC